MALLAEFLFATGSCRWPFSFIFICNEIRDWIKAFFLYDRANALPSIPRYSMHAC